MSEAASQRETAAHHGAPSRTEPHHAEHDDGAARFERIEIIRTPGVPSGRGYVLSELSPGINLIHGPNGVGKTTTARTMQQILWSGRLGPRETIASARLTIGGAAWEAELHGGSATWRRDRRESAPPALGPPEEAHQYWLAFDDLLRAEDAGLAKAIADATLGGYDLDAAAQTLGFGEPKAHHAQERKKAERTRQKLREATQTQRAVDEEARQLDALKQRKNEAVAAGQNAGLLDEALRYRKAADACDEIDAHLRQFEPAVAQLRGDEKEQLDRLSDELSEQRGNRRSERQRIEQQRDRQRKLGLPESGVASGDLRTARASRDRLGNVEQELRHRRGERDRAARQEQEARQRLGASVSEEQLQQLQAIELPEAEQLARRSERMRARRNVLGERVRALSAEVHESEGQGGPEAEPETLREGLSALGRWLAAPVGGGLMRRSWLALWTGAAALIVALSAALAAVAHWLWLLVGLTGPLLWLTAWWATRSASGGSAETHQREFERTRLKSPKLWVAEMVAERAAELARQLVRAETRHRQQEHRRALDQENTELEEEHNRLQQQRAELERRLGIELDLSDEWLASLAVNVAGWQQARDQCAAAEQSVKELERQRDQHLRAVNTVLSRYGFQAAEDAEAAKETVGELERLQGEHSEAQQAIEDAEHRLRDSIDPAIERAERQQRRLFERLGLEPGDTKALDRAMRQLDAYRKLAEQRREQKGVRDAAEHALRQHPQLMERDQASLKAERDQQQQHAEQLDELTKEITQIEYHIDAAKRGRELTDALAAHEQQLDRLRAVRDADCAAAAGAMVTQFVRRQTADRTRPAVFERAAELLTRITAGRLALEVDRTEGKDSRPVFRARDTVAEREKELDQLSRGERVQLLLAARLAFAEQAGGEARPPLLMDETLANSDDERAAAVIDAVAAAAQTGWQVFYFTAQPDELGKWISRLDEREVAHRAIDLAALRGRSEAARTLLPESPVSPPEVPSPAGMTHAEYGQALNVPGLDPHRQSVADVHLWHLVDEPDALHGLLRQRIVRCGELQQMLERGATDALPADEGFAQRMRAKVRALEAAFEAWRRGRGAPVDRATLADCQSVSDKYLPAVAEVAEACGGDAAAMLERLADEVRGWGPEKTRKLREELDEAGYLDEREPLDESALRAEIHAAIGRELRDELIDHEWVERVLAALMR